MAIAITDLKLKYLKMLNNNRKEKLMKNVRELQLKKCIFLEFVEFEDIIHQLFGDKTIVDCSLDGISIYNDKDLLGYTEIANALAEYFDVEEITSWHADDADFIGVWIVYKDKPITKRFTVLCDMEEGEPDAVIVSENTSAKTIESIIQNAKYDNEEWSLDDLLAALPSDCVSGNAWGNFFEKIYY